MLTHERLIELLAYDSDTGRFVWKVPKGTRSRGMVAGVIGSLGYRHIRIDGQPYYAHRLAWLYITGRWPSGGLDHKNGEPGDNRISNLREANQSQNGANMKTKRRGLKGVWKKGSRWRAAVKKGGKRLFLGMFRTEEEAHQAYCAAASRLHGDFARFQ